MPRKSMAKSQSARSVKTTTTQASSARKTVMMPDSHSQARKSLVANYSTAT